ncbi:MAG: ADP-ribosylation factor-like protein [Candidatus Hodarchaeota archaeon]
MSYLSQRSWVKFVLSGLAASGTTTVFRTLIDGYLPSAWHTYHATIDYTHENKVVGNFNLAFFDLGGQTTYLNRFVRELGEFIFNRTTALIYVLDTGKIQDIHRAKYYLDCEVTLLDRYCPKALIFILQHKSDIIPLKLRKETRELFQDYLCSNIMQKTYYYDTFSTSESFINILESILRETIRSVDQDANLDEFIHKFWKKDVKKAPESPHPIVVRDDDQVAKDSWEASFQGFRDAIKRS